MALHPEQDADHLRLFFEYGISFNGPASYEVLSSDPVSLPRQIARDAEQGIQILRQVLERLFDHLHVPCFPLRDEILAPVGPGERAASPFFSGRFDILLDSDGRPQLIELNADRNGLQRESMADPLHGDAFRRRYLEVLASYWQRYGHAPERAPRVAVVIAPAYREESSLAPFYGLTIQEGLGWPSLIAGVDNLWVDRSGRVLAFGEPIDLILRQYPTEYLYELPCGPELIAAHRRGKVLIVNDPAAIRLQSKSWMAALTGWLRDASGPLTPEERSALRPLVPYTASLADRRLPADPADPGSPQVPLRSALLEHPERWVLKPALGRYSWGVTCGALAKPDGWQAAIRYALARPEHWIVQQYVVQKPVPLRRWYRGENRTDLGYVNFGLHLLDGQIAAWGARCSLSAITDDAWFAPVAFVD